MSSSSNYIPHLAGMDTAVGKAMQVAPIASTDKAGTFVRPRPTSTLDVVVPCYNYGRFLTECVRSVLEQSCTSVRVMIIDDCSQDNTPEMALRLVDEDQRVSFIRHKVNRGHIATYNEGLDWASGDYVTILSADDYLLPGAVERAVGLLKARSDIGFVFGNALNAEEDGSLTEAAPLPELDRQRAHHIIPGARFVQLMGCRNLVPTPTAVVRTKLQKNVGGYSNELPHAGDMEMWLRLAAHGAVGFINAPQAVYRKHETNMNLAYNSNFRLLDIKERKKAIDKFYTEHGEKVAVSARHKEEILYVLGVEAIGWASAAFNEGDFDASNNLWRLGVECHPEAGRSAAAYRLRTKKIMGRKMFFRVHATVRWIFYMISVLIGTSASSRAFAISRTSKD